MRTSDDLSEVFRTLVAEADEHLPAARGSWIGTSRTEPSFRRSRVLVPLVAAAAVVVLAVAALAFALTRPSLQQRAAAPTTVPTSPAVPRYGSMPLHELVFTVPARVGSVAATYAERAYQSLELDTPRSGQVFVTFHRSGAPRPYAAGGATPVRVDGRPGVYAVTDTVSEGPGDVFRGVAWRYGPDEWATVGSQDYDVSRSQALGIARAVRLGRHPLQTPLRIRLTGATERDWGTNYPRTTVDSNAGAYVVLRDRGHVAQVSLEDLPATSTDTTTINGRTAYWSNHHTVLAIDFGPQPDVQVMAISGGRREALRVARATSVTTTPNSVSTWFDATDALP